MKRDSLDIYVTTFNGVRKFKNRSAMRVILFFEKYSKWNLNYVNAKKKTEKTFFVSQIIAFEDVTIIYLY